MPKGTWYTPIARLKNQEQVFTKIDNKGWVSHWTALNYKVTNYLF